MAAVTGVKAGPVGGEKTQFRTKMVNGKAQIYFDALDEAPAITKPTRNIRTTNTTRLPEQMKHQPPPPPPSRKPPPAHPPTKPMKKTNKVTFSDNQSQGGVFMTMDEIAELVKAAKESSQLPTHPNMEYREPPPPSSVPQLSNELYPVTNVSPSALAPISPRQEALGEMADKKRQKWMREKAEMDRMKLEVEYDQLKHQLSPVHQKASTSPERSGIPLDYYSSTNKPPLPPSVNRPNDNVQNDPTKTRLIEKKQQQWRQENADKAPVWNPFGRPGAGAPNTNENPPSKMPQSSSNIVMPYRPPDPSFASPSIVLNDQTRVPAAMRTNLLFGDVRFEDEVKSAKELERRQWLEDLQKQIEENKRKKFTEQETERRQDFLQENIQPLLQEAANRHPTQVETSPAPSSNTLTTTTSGQETTKSRRHDSVVKQTYDKILEATEMAKYEKKAQLIEKLKRNGHQTDLLARTLPDMKNMTPVPTQKVYDRQMDMPVRQPPPPPPATTVNVATRIEPLQLNVGTETRRDEAVNTINSTFRSDNSAQTDFRMPPHKQLFTFAREESDLPPQIPQHLLRDNRTTKKNVRIRSLEDPQRQRQAQSQPKPTTRDDGAVSQRSSQAPIDLVHRPLWNYQNPRHREYVPNSKRDPNYDKRHHSQDRPRQTEEIPKKATNNRWNSDSQLQQKERKLNLPIQSRPTNIRQPPPPPPQREESIGNLLKAHRPPRQEAFVDDESNFHNISSLDKYEHFTPYIRTDEILDPSKAFSPVPVSREPSAHRSRTIIYDDHHRRQNTSVQPPPYHVPPARQEHILQQLTAIKENLVRRQQEVASSMNAIQV